MANVPQSNIQAIGENVKVELTEDEIIIRINRKHRGGPSKSGDTTRVASTLGNKQITAEGIMLGLNAYVYPDR